ncbi:MAG: pyridoxamine 5'-phosphate oxidase family protein [Actinomycetota bacterium]
MNDITNATKRTTPLVDADQEARLLKAIDSRSFAVLSTVSPAGFPHAAGVQYVLVDGDGDGDGGPVLFSHTMRSSRKARNVAADDRVGVVIPVRKLPVGPPFTVQFQGRAEVLDMDDPEIVALLDAGRLKAIASHGELDEPDGCYLRITPNATVHSYGIGVSMLGVARDPLHVGARSTQLGVA